MRNAKDLQRSRLAPYLTWEQYQHLNELYKQRNPTIPDRARVEIKDQMGTAKGHTLLVKLVCLALRLAGHQVEQINTTGRPGKDIERRDVLGRLQFIEKTWIPTTGRKGSADISATIQGRSVKIECKTGSGRQSLDQVRYQAEVERAGGVYIVCRHLDDVWRLVCDDQQVGKVIYQTGLCVR